jgi:hypothetical protein
LKNRPRCPIRSPHLCRRPVFDSLRWRAAPSGTRLKNQLTERACGAANAVRQWFSGWPRRTPHSAWPQPGHESAA